MTEKVVEHKQWGQETSFVITTLHDPPFRSSYMQTIAGPAAMLIPTWLLHGLVCANLPVIRISPFLVKLVLGGNNTCIGTFT